MTAIDDFYDDNVILEEIIKRRPGLAVPESVPVDRVSGFRQPGSAAAEIKVELKFIVTWDEWREILDAARVR